MFKTSNLQLWLSLDSLLTFVKEGNVVVLYRPKVEVLPEIRLFWGVRCEKTLSMESFLWTRGAESIIREEELSTCSGEVTFDAYLQRSDGQTSVQCSESDLQSVDRDRRANPAAQRGPGSKRLKMQLMTDNVNFNISHELIGNNSINAFGPTINHPEKQPGCTAVAHLTRINVHPLK